MFYTRFGSNRSQGNTISAMGSEKTTTLNERRAVAVMKQIQANVKADKRVTVSELVRAVGMERSMFYRWQEDTWADSITLAQLADLADWLERNYAHPSFISMWQSASLHIQE